MTKSNKILCVIGSILIAFVGLFGFIFAIQDDKVVKADSVNPEVYDFQSGIFTFPVAVFSTANDLSTINTNFNDFLSVSFRFNSNSFSMTTRTSGYSLTGITATSSITNPINYTVGQWRNNWYYTSSNSNSWPANARYFTCSIYYPSSDFNYNIYRIKIEQASGILGQYNGTSIFFYDVNDNYVWLQFPLYNGNSNTAEYINFVPARTIFVNNPNNLTDNQYYQTGYEAGLDANQQNVYDSGYQAAIDENQASWEQTGYNRGVADSNQYSFFNLIGAAFDVPIGAVFGFIDKDVNSPTYNQRVGGMLNFELLGVNLKDFFFAILTFGIIIFIARLLLH